MVRKLKYHEQKLLKKVDFINWKDDYNLTEANVISKYRISKREDYVIYWKFADKIKKLVGMLAKLDHKDPFRSTITDQLLDKLYNMGLIDSKKSLVGIDKFTPVHFCRRRLGVVMVRMKMAENLKAAITFVEQGHVRIGPKVVTDPAFLVTRNLEDFVTWVDGSKIKQKVLKYNNLLDDYDLL